MRHPTPPKPSPRVLIEGKFDTNEIDPDIRAREKITRGIIYVMCMIMFGFIIAGLFKGFN